jgi:hypothetical protein
MGGIKTLIGYEPWHNARGHAHQMTLRVVFGYERSSGSHLITTTTKRTKGSALSLLLGVVCNT